MEDTFNQSGKKEVWKKDENTALPIQKNISNRKANKIKRFLKLIKRWYKNSFIKNSTPPSPYEYFKKQNRYAANKKRKQKFSELKMSLLTIFTKQEKKESFQKENKLKLKRKKFKDNLKNSFLQPLKEITNKQKKDNNKNNKNLELEFFFNAIKYPFQILFNKKLRAQTYKGKSDYFYYHKEQRKLRLQRFEQFRSSLITFPVRSFKWTVRAFKKLFKIIFSFKNEYRLFKEEIFRLKANEDVKNRLIYTYLNSTISFLLSFIIIFFINQFATVYICSLFNVPTILHSLGGFINYNDRFRQIMDYFDIIYLVGPYSYLWTRFNIIVIYGAAPLLSLLLAVVFYRLYSIANTRLRFLRLFFLWSLINSFNMFFGSYIVGAITRSGFIYCSEWIFFSRKYDIEEIIIMVCSAIMLITIGFFSRTFFLRSADHKDLIIPKNKTFYLLAQVLLPYISGISFLILLSVPYFVHYNLFFYLPLLLVVVTVVISPRGYQSENITIARTAKRNYNILKIGTFLILIIVLTFKIFFYKGITLV